MPRRLRDMGPGARTWALTPPASGMGMGRRCLVLAGRLRVGRRAVTYVHQSASRRGRQHVRRPLRWVPHRNRPVRRREEHRMKGRRLPCDLVDACSSGSGPAPRRSGRRAEFTDTCPEGLPTIDTRTVRCQPRCSGRSGLAANLRRTARPLGAPSVPTDLTNRVERPLFGLISMPTSTPQPVTVPPSNLPCTRVSARTS